MKLHELDNNKGCADRGGFANGVLLRMIESNPSMAFHEQQHPNAITFMCDTSPHSIKQVALENCTPSHICNFGKKICHNLMQGGLNSCLSWSGTTRAAGLPLVFGSSLILLYLTAHSKFLKIFKIKRTSSSGF